MDKELSEILVKYRALKAAMGTYYRLRDEVASGFVALSESQKQAYVKAAERIDREES